MNNSQTSFYLDLLYPFQDHLLQVIQRVDTGFYLTGGTVSSRVYLQHRFSGDLDFFVNDDNRFGLWVERIIQSLTAPGRQCRVLTREERFARLVVQQNEMTLKLFSTTLETPPESAPGRFDRSTRRAAIPAP